MKGYVLGALVVTFFAGMSSGFLIGRESAPVNQPTSWIQRCVDQLQTRGVTKQEDLDRAREIYEDYRDKLMALKSRVNAVLGDQIEDLSRQTEQKIQGILDSYETGGK